MFRPKGEQVASSPWTEAEAGAAEAGDMLRWAEEGAKLAVRLGAKAPDARLKLVSFVLRSTKGEGAQLFMW